MHLDQTTDAADKLHLQQSVSHTQFPLQDLHLSWSIMLFMVDTYGGGILLTNFFSSDFCIIPFGSVHITSGSTVRE